MKRAQMEIMGLAIIVILISIGMLFAIRFVVLKEPTEYKQEFTRSNTASNILNTLLKTTTIDCYGLSFNALYQDCANNIEIECSYTEGGNPVTKSSCDYVAEKTEYIISQTLEEWHQGYDFKAYTIDPATGSEELLSYDSNTEMQFTSSPTDEIVCTGVKTHKRYPIPINSAGQILYLTLDICQKET